MYLLYFYRGILKIKHGKMVIGSFVSDDDCRHTMIPKEPLTVEHGKIWCEDELNIPYAASILIDHREKYVKDMQDKWSKDFGFEEDKMAAKKTETREDTMGANLILTFAELRYLKSLIRQKIVCYESRKYDERWAGKKYSDYSDMEKARMDSDLEMCYEIFDHLLKIGIREDVI